MYYLTVQDQLPSDAEEERYHDMNPDGFWEDGRFSVSGFRYKPQLRSLIAEVKAAERPLVGKIVSQGLSKTDPTYVEKVVVMIRHPRAVAKSQERLGREKLRTLGGEEFDINSEVVHSPQMFIRVSIELAEWFTAHPEVPYLMVDFDDLIDRPTESLWRLTGFIGEGDFRCAAGNIKPKLRRSYPEKRENTLWGEAERTYDWLRRGEFHEIIEFFKDRGRHFHRETQTWLCPRFMGGVNEAHCKNCKASAAFRGSLRRFSDEKGIEWKLRPCPYEVAYALDEPLISIEESIAHNFWEEDHEPIRHREGTGRRFRPKSLPRTLRTTRTARDWRKYRGQRRSGSSR
jgi:hypothetical protein